MFKKQTIIKGIILLLAIILLVSAGWAINENLIKRKATEKKGDNGD